MTTKRVPSRSTVDPLEQLVWPITPTIHLHTGTTNWTTDPLVLSSGELFFGAEDLSWAINGMALHLHRTYRDIDTGIPEDPDFGPSFYSSLNIRVDPVLDEGELDYVEVVLGNGEDIDFDCCTNGTDFTAESMWGGYTLEYVDVGQQTCEGQYVMTDKSGGQYTFSCTNSLLESASLVSVRDRYDQGFDYSYDGANLLTKISWSTDAQLAINIERGVQNRITRIYDYANRTIDYEYDGDNRLTRVAGACAGCSAIPAVRYSYDNDDRLTEIIDDVNTNFTHFEIEYDSNYRVTSIQSPYGGTTGYAYEADPFSVTLTSPSGNEYRYEFDTDYLTKKTVAMEAGGSDDIVYTYEHDDAVRLTKMTRPDGAVVGLAYDDRSNMTLLKLSESPSSAIYLFQGEYATDYNRLLTKINALGHTSRYEYDGAGSLTREVRADSSTRQYAYDSSHRLTQAIDGEGRTHAFEYDGRGFVSTATVDAAGLALETQFTRDLLGRMLTLRSPEGHETHIEYEAGGRVTRHVTPAGIENQYEYDAHKRLTKRELMDGQNPAFTWTYARNLAGDITQSIAPGALTTSYEYDLSGWKTRILSPESRYDKFIHDKHGRVITLERGQGAVSVSPLQAMVYDTMGRVVTSRDAESHDTLYAYDGFGRRTQIKDCAGDFTLTEYDDAFRPTAQKRLSASLTLLTHGKTVYDELGRAITTRVKASPSGADGDDDALTIVTYDDNDRVLTRRVFNDSGYSDTVYTYDGAGRRTLMRDPDGFETTHTFDDDGRLTLVTNPRGHTMRYVYDGDNRLVTSTDALNDYALSAYDLRSNVTQVSRYDSGDTLLARSKYQYDAAGRQTKSRDKFSPGGADDDNSDYVLATQYDRDGLVTKSTSAKGFDTTYAYDAFGRLSRTTLPDGSYQIREMNLDGATTKSYSYEIVSGATRTFTFVYQLDCLDRVTAAINNGPDGTFGNGDDLTTSYVYDAAGRQVTATDEAGRHTVYAYDAFSRNTKVTEDSAGIARVTDSLFDRAGRNTKLIAFTDSPSSGAQTTLYAYNLRGLQTYVTYEETGTVTHNYDAAGNLTKRTDEEGRIVDLEYDAFNRPTRRLKNGATSNIEAYAYDALGRLVTAQKGTSGSPAAVSRSVLQYDPLSRVTRDIQKIASWTAKTGSYFYDKGGNRLSQWYFGGTPTVNYDYDSRDR
ncbi:MAG: hypothetical protein L6R00_19225, partial [Phycisphaerae bacterium]|nr:hypothetical protein [Phycisphaerae bacterium]